MSNQTTEVADIRLQPSGAEAGTSPDDRRFRPDVQGLRAVAVLLVVLYHAGVPHLGGGYVGVDVFFVISGFVITGVLLRERAATGATSIVGFYARRVRRILPAATLTIVVTVVLSYVVLGFVDANSVANDGRWAAVFLVNFHFASVGTNYLQSQLPPSPLQNFWSLSVEEQFYVVYPTLVLVVAGVGRRIPFRVRLGAVLVAIIVGSYAWSIAQTSSQPINAYFSPFTRAWELALGALIALATPALKRVGAGVAAAATWVGLGAIVVAAFVFNGNTAYPGSLVAVPVLGAGLVIAGGTVVPPFGVERLLALAPLAWIGKLSYSWYLWHYPILILVAENSGKSSLPLGESLALMALALGVAAASYAVIENPIRHARLSSWRSVALGAALIGVTLTILTVAISAESVASTTNYRVRPASLTAVLHAVAESPGIKQVPANLVPPVAAAASDWAGLEYHGCVPAVEATTEPTSAPSCVIGDPHGTREMVVWGDSHALMWLPAFDTIAKQAHDKLIILGKPDCPASMLGFRNPPGYGPATGRYTACDEWHTWVLAWLARNHPDLLVITQQAVPSQFTPAQWQAGLARTLAAVKAEHVPTVVLGNIPIFPDQPPACLAAHLSDAQACSVRPVSAWTPFIGSERRAAAAAGVAYIDPTRWFCTSICSPVVGDLEVYLDKTHITAVYAQYLSTVLGQALAPSLSQP